MYDVAQKTAISNPLICIGEKTPICTTFLIKNSQITLIASTCIGMKIKLCTPVSIKYIFAKQKDPHIHGTETQMSERHWFAFKCSVPMYVRVLRFKILSR